MKEVGFALKEKLGKTGKSEREVGKQVETERRTLFHKGNKREALEYQNPTSGLLSMLRSDWLSYY